VMFSAMQSDVRTYPINFLPIVQSRQRPPEPQYWLQSYRILAP